MTGAYKLVRKSDGVELAPGDDATTFRGESCTFDGIAANPRDGSSGKVYVSLNEQVRTLFPGVIGCELVSGIGE